MAVRAEAAGDYVERSNRVVVETEELTGAVAAWLGYLSDYRRLSPLTLAAYTRHLAAWLGWARAAFDRLPPPPEISRRDIIAYSRSIAGGPNTIRAKLTALSSFFSWLEETEEIAHNPVRGIRLPKKARRVVRTLTGDEFRRLLAAARAPWHRCLLELLWGTGCRCAEVRTLRLLDVDFEHDELLVRGKGQKERLVPMSSRVREAILAYLPARRRFGGDTLLVNKAGNPLENRRVCEAVKLLADRAGIDRARVSPHKFRHTFATELVRAGADLKTVQELLGHTDPSTTMIYLHSEMGRKRAAVEALAQTH